MKEFDAQTGGRYVYVDDVKNLQELALAFASIFDDCDNFIISGCEVSGTSISEGYVYINGKIRHFTGASGISVWPQYLYENNRKEILPYASGDNKVGRNVYGCVLAESVPTALDPITNEVPAFIQITEQGGMKMNDAFFAKYAVVLQSKAGTQTVNDDIVFTKSIQVGEALKANGNLELTQGVAQCKIFYSSTKDLNIQSYISGGKTYRFVIKSNGFCFYVGNTELFTIQDSAILTQLPISALKIFAGAIGVQENHIINRSAASDTGCININMKGYNDGTNYYRDTYIGNGKGTAIVRISGRNSEVEIIGSLKIKSSNTAAIVLGKAKTIDWHNDSDNQIAYLGYNTSGFAIRNLLGDITITAHNAVNICPAIKENGVLLSNRYAKKDSGLSQFVNTTNTQAVLCNQIGAATTQEVAVLSNQMNNTYAKKDKLLSDMAITLADKKTIRDNINAEEKGMCEPKWHDTSWCPVIGADGLFVRQKGNMVCLQGWVEIGNELSLIITLPQEIAMSSFDIGGGSVAKINNGIGLFTYKIAKNTRQCTITAVNGYQNCKIDISLIYMV